MGVHAHILPSFRRLTSPRQLHIAVNVLPRRVVDVCLGNGVDIAIISVVDYARSVLHVLLPMYRSVGTISCRWKDKGI